MCFFLRFDTSLAKPCQDLSSRWLAAIDSDLSSFTADDLKEFSALQKREFISLLLQSNATLSVCKLEAMDSLYQLSTIKNSEICFRLVLCCAHCVCVSLSTIKNSEICFRFGSLLCTLCVCLSVSVLSLCPCACICASVCRNPPQSMFRLRDLKQQIGAGAGGKAYLFIKEHLALAGVMVTGVVGCITTCWSHGDWGGRVYNHLLESWWLGW